MSWLANALGAETGYELAWILVGLGGQALFMMRFLVQWIASEKAKRSVVPVAFWYFSIGGAAVLLAYAIWRADPVFILGQSLGFFIYGRNLWLIHAERRRNRLLGSTGGDTDG
ncbi:MAG: lipid-A-disaccharide synthase N-terminal domain-containing protein [Pseudomonadota bacterium]